MLLLRVLITCYALLILYATHTASLALYIPQTGNIGNSQNANKYYFTSSPSSSSSSSFSSTARNSQSAATQQLLYHIVARSGRLVDALNVEEPIVCGREFLFYRYEYISLLSQLEIRARQFEAALDSVNPIIDLPPDGPATRFVIFLRESQGYPPLTSVHKWSLVVDMLAPSTNHKLISHLHSIALAGLNLAKRVAGVEVIWANLGIWEMILHCEKTKLLLYPASVFRLSNPISNTDIDTDTDTDNNNKNNNNTTTTKKNVNSQNEDDIDSREERRISAEAEWEILEIHVRRVWENIERKYFLLREYASEEILGRDAALDAYEHLENLVASQELLPPVYLRPSQHKPARPTSQPTPQLPLQRQRQKQQQNQSSNQKPPLGSKYESLRKACLDDIILREDFFRWDQPRSNITRLLSAFTEHLLNFDLLVIESTA